MFNKYMNIALDEAKKALEEGEIPVGAVIVKDNIVIAKAHNLREGMQNSLAHAEISAINRACKYLRNWRLEDCDIYVTLEPCPMCCGAILQSRIRNVYFGAYSPENGCMGTAVNLPYILKNKSVTVYGGIMEDECVRLLSNFHFKNK